MSFFKKNKNKIMIISVTISLIILMGFTNGERDNVSRVENLTGTIFRPVNSLLYEIGNKSFSIFDHIRTNSSLRKENEKLKAEVLDLEEKNRKLEAVVANKEYLKLEYDLKSKTQYNLLESNIIGKESTNLFERFIIDKGLNDGVKTGQTIVQGIKDKNGVIVEGVIGRVVEVGNDSAKVISIVDETSKIGFKVNRSQDGGVLSGAVGENLSGYLFDIDAEVKKGDSIYTSGMGGIFQADLYIGEVVEIKKKDDELIKSLTVDPSIDFKKLSRVFIIKE